MKAAVRAGIVRFNSQFEGVVPEMYVDVLGLVTCAIGNLIDPIGAALALPWHRRADGGLATPSEIAAEWHAVKDGRLAWYPQRTPRPLYLDALGVQAAFDVRLNSNEGYLVRRWANWEQWPADAQMGAHSIAWAAGAGWQAPQFDAAVNALDFRACAGTAGTDGNDPTTRGHAWLRDTKPADDASGNHKPTLNPGLRPRNLANQWLFQNAEVVIADGRDPEQLYYPAQMDG